MIESDWTTCPECYREEVVRLKKAVDNVTWSYGKVPQHEWLEMFNSLERVDDPEVDFDLREDYEIGFGTDGIFLIKYKCKCAECDFEFSFSHSAVPLYETT